MRSVVLNINDPLHDVANALAFILEFAEDNGEGIQIGDIQEDVYDCAVLLGLLYEAGHPLLLESEYSNIIGILCSMGDTVSRKVIGSVCNIRLKMLSYDNRTIVEPWICDRLELSSIVEKKLRSAGGNILMLNKVPSDAVLKAIETVQESVYAKEEGIGRVFVLR